MTLCDQLEAQQHKKHEHRIRLNNATLDKLLTAPTPEEFAQHWQRICDNFDLLYDAPETVGKLRQAILQLAVQGKLVAQDPEDEHASILLKKIKAKKEQLLQKKKLRKEGDFLPIEIERVTFRLPEGWIRVKLGEVINCLDHIRKPVNKTERQTRSGDIPYYGANGQVGWINDFIFNEDLVLVVEDETFIGRQKPFCYKISGKSWVNNHAHVLQPTSGIDVDFLNYSLAYYPFTALTSGTTGRKKLTRKVLLSVPYVLPPLSEQNRIVAKVDQLMALCDELEAGLVQAQTEGGKLMEAVVHHVLAE